MKAIIKPSKLSGHINAISSKSYAHRYMIASALADEPTIIKNYGNGEDVIATLNVLSELGMTYSFVKDDICINPIWNKVTEVEKPIMRCHESGTTLRLTLPVVAAVIDEATFTGSGRLPNRPLKELEEALSKSGKEIKIPYRNIDDEKDDDEINQDSIIEKNDNAGPELEILSMKGKLQPGVYRIPGNISSQYVSGLLMALPLLDGDSQLQLTTQLESVQYVEMTRQVLFQYGIETNVQFDEFITYHIKGNQKYISPKEVTVKGDWSNAAVFLAARELHYGSYGDTRGMLSSSLIGDDSASGIGIDGLEQDFLQGDSEVEHILPQFFTGQQSRTIDIKNIPDLLPILSIVAAGTVGRTAFINGRRLRFKESDRIHATAKMIVDLGGKVEETGGGIIVYGTGFKGGVVDSFHDHRIIMAATIAGSLASEPVTILHAESVNKSYPGFFDDFIKLGGDVEFEE